MLPLVTVVIPTYKRAWLVPRAIESVRRQTYQNVEILVVDDGSADDTEKVVKSIADERVKYLRHDVNRGLPAARNTGIRAARGDYVAFLDDDDEWREDKLVKQVEAITKYDAVFAGALINGRYPKRHHSAEVTQHDLRRGNNFAPSTLLVRTAVIRDVGFDETLRMGEDWDAYIRLAQTYRVGYVNEPLLFLNDGSHQRMTNAAINKPLVELDKQMKMLLKHKAFFGPYWFRRHVAAQILSYFGQRNSKLRQISCAIRRCGVGPVLGVFAWKIRRALQRSAADAWNVLLTAREDKG